MPTNGSGIGLVSMGARDDSYIEYGGGGRMYDPLIGRFLSPDSIVPDLRNPQSLNRYSYVYNRPLNLVDADGHEGKSPECIKNPTMCGSPPPQLQENTAQLIVAQNDTQAAPTAGGIVMTSKGGKGVWQSVKDGAAKLLGNLCSGILAIACSGAGAKAAKDAVDAANADGDPTNEAAAAVNSLGRLPIPKVPSGMDVAKFGQQVMQWGTGSESARERISTITHNELVRNGVTLDMAREWVKFYVNETLRNPNNPSAQGRAELMQHVVKLLEDGN